MEQSETTANPLARFLLFYDKISRFQAMGKIISWSYIIPQDLYTDQRSLIYDM